MIYRLPGTGKLRTYGARSGMDTSMNPILALGDNCRKGAGVKGSIAADVALEQVFVTGHSAGVDFRETVNQFDQRLHLRANPTDYFQNFPVGVWQIFPVPNGFMVGNPVTQVPEFVQLF